MFGVKPDLRYMVIKSSVPYAIYIHSFFKDAVMNMIIAGLGRKMVSTDITIRLK